MTTTRPGWANGDVLLRDSPQLAEHLIALLRERPTLALEVFMGLQEGRGGMTGGPSETMLPPGFVSAIGELSEPLFRREYLLDPADLTTEEWDKVVGRRDELEREVADLRGKLQAMEADMGATARERAGVSDA